MKTMSFLVWTLPILYMLHDFEEIILAEAWASRYKKEINQCFGNNQPFGLNYASNYQTPSFASVIYLSFSTYTILSLLCILLQNYVLWIGAFVPIFLHFILIHIGICFKFKHYVPGLITSILFIGPSLLCLVTAQQLLHYSLSIWIVASLVGSFCSLFLMKCLHRLLKRLSNRFNRYSSSL